MRSSVQTKGTGIAVGSGSIYALMGREKVLGLSETPMVYQVMLQQNKKTLLEGLFRSVNQLLMCSVLSEYVFTLEFFNLRKSHNKIVFEGIFKASLCFLGEWIKNVVG